MTSAVPLQLMQEDQRLIRGSEGGSKDRISATLLWDILLQSRGVQLLRLHLQIRHFQVHVVAMP